jgi:hypothetical protein
MLSFFSSAGDVSSDKELCLACDLINTYDYTGWIQRAEAEDRISIVR